MVILIVDDDVKNLKSFEACLLAKGHDLILATNGQEAINEVDNLKRFNQTVDVLLSDYLMPGMNGLELIRIFRKRHPEIPVILMTAFGSEEVRKKVLNFGGQYLEKPFTPAGLLEVLGNTNKKRLKANNGSIFKPGARFM